MRNAGLKTCGWMAWLLAACFREGRTTPSRFLAATYNRRGVLFFFVTCAAQIKIPLLPALQIPPPFYLSVTRRIRLLTDTCASCLPIDLDPTCPPRRMRRQRLSVGTTKARWYRYRESLSVRLKPVGTVTVKACLYGESRSIR